MKAKRGNSAEKVQKVSVLICIETEAGTFAVRTSEKVMENESLRVSSALARAGARAERDILAAWTEAIR